jgi:hypothetical protein
VRTYHLCLAFALGCVFIATTCWAATPAYPVSALPLKLLRDAASVVRLEEAVVTFDRADRYTYRVRRAVTILKPAASPAAQLVVFSSKLRKITDLSARIYDGEGRLTRRLSGAPDWRDVSATDDGTFLDDSRARVADARQAMYPYTVELTYEIVSTNPLFLPDWQPQHTWNQAVERATFRLQHSAALPVRWQAHQMPATAAQPDTTVGALVEHRWMLTNYPALVPEPLAPAFEEQVPVVWCAATEFEVEGYAGTQRSWADLGRWSYQLNVGRDALPPTLIAEMAALRDTVADPRRRAQRVYEKMQRTTRYVSIQLGLGGWQTIPAMEVARTGYGDCKALTNYTRALLGAAGLPAYCALVGAGDDAPDLHPEWVASQFNHVILCVPLPAVKVDKKAGVKATSDAVGDTVWLECTSQVQPFGALGDFTANRHALLLTPTGGRLVRTPTLGATNTYRSRRLTLRLEASGAATASVRTRRTGALGDDYARLLPLDPADQRRQIQEAIAAPTPATLTKVRLTALPATAAGAVVREELDLTLPNAAARAGQRLRLPLNLLSRWSAAPADSARRAPLHLPAGVTYTDTVVVQLPPGVRAEALPPPVQVTTPFGSYAAAVTAAPDGASFTYCRALRTVGGVFSATQYAAYVAFSEQIARADRQLATLLLPPPTTATGR